MGSREEQDGSGDNGGGVATAVPWFTKWRNILAFFLFGLVNNYAYVVMLSAALDIIHSLEKGGGANHTSTDGNDTTGACVLSYNETTNVTGYPPRELCQYQGTSVILLADIVPAVISKLFAPYFMHFIPYWIRIVGVVICNLASFTIVALSTSEVLALFGVVCASIGSGFGEITFLSLTTRYDKSTLSGWSSGTGAAGVAGALIYAGLRTFLSAKITLLAQLFFPVLMLVSYVFILKSPDTISKELDDDSIKIQDLSRSSEDEDTISLLPNRTHSIQKTFDLKKIKLFNQDESKHWLGHVKYIPHLIKYMVPLFLVYFAEYAINQGFFELLYNPDTHIGGYCLDQRTQYRWLQVAYQIGVLISRSSLPIIYIRHFWILSLLQVVNFVFFFVASVYLFIPSFWLTLFLIVYEGLLGGGVYANAFYTVSKEVPDIHREFSMSVVGVADSFGICLAALSAFFIHHYICGQFIGYVNYELW